MKEIAKRAALRAPCARRVVLDELVNGGYFLGSTTVIAGISGVGKSVMALH